MSKKKIFAICGSTRSTSTNLSILQLLAERCSEEIDFDIYDNIANLPHFNSEIDDKQLPDTVRDFRAKIQAADGVIICTPEYVFSLPGSMKNALDWTVASIVFSDKPAALITAGMSGEKTHEQLALVMKTIGATFSEDTRLLIQGAKSKFDTDGQILDLEVSDKLDLLLDALLVLMEKAE